jgi:2-phosphoglycerate kinase
MQSHKGKRLFITGIPTAGKTYLAKRLADEVGGVVVILDDFRESLSKDEKYKKWTNFYLNKDEEKYLKETRPEEQWKDLVNQSEGLWPAFLEEIAKYENEEKTVIFECVNILPHLAKRDLYFAGIVLIGSSYEEILKRNIESPRWGDTLTLQELEAKHFFEIERVYYKREAEKYDYPTFETADQAFDTAVKLIK